MHVYKKLEEMCEQKKSPDSASCFPDRMCNYGLVFPVIGL